jgi:arginine:agmatine antiporter
MAEPGKIGVVAATLMVAGTIMGSGIFMLSANLAATGGIVIFGSLATVLGAVAIAMARSRLTGVVDGSAGGSHSFVRKSSRSTGSGKRGGCRGHPGQKRACLP